MPFSAKNFIRTQAKLDRGSRRRGGSMTTPEKPPHPAHYRTPDRRIKNRTGSLKAGKTQQQGSQEKTGLEAEQDGANAAARPTPQAGRSSRYPSNRREAPARPNHPREMSAEKPEKHRPESRLTAREGIVYSSPGFFSGQGFSAANPG